MNKQETINKKWVEIVGEENFPKLRLDENGFSDWNCRKYFPRTLDDKIFSKFKRGSAGRSGSDLIYRPKSLTGIENNNGWILITEEKRVPEHDVWICNPKIKGCFFHDALTRIPKKYTHYQIVERPKPIMH